MFADPSLVVSHNSVHATVAAVDSHAEPEIGFPDGLAVDVQRSATPAGRCSRRSSATNEVYPIPAGEETDFASVPSPFVWFIPRYGRYTKAAILHDGLCRLAREGSFAWLLLADSTGSG
jgi:hypothetical protein